MSRIAGIFDTGGSPPGALVTQMLAVAMGGSSSAVRTAPAIAIGIAGEDTAKVGTAGDILVVMDGTVYNRADFAPSANDAELVAALYAKGGLEQALAALNGDFALAVFDPRDRSLSLARDRFGAKPLYYTEVGGALAFASRLRSLLAIPGVSREPDRRFVACFAGSHYRTFDNEPGRSPYAAIKQLPAASILRIKGQAPQVATYWRLEEQPDLKEPEAQLKERYRALLDDAVNIRMRTSHKPAFTLSGGMDSSSVLAFAARHSGNKQVAYSTVYEDATYDETAEIKTMLDATVSDWHAVRIGTPDLSTLVPRMIAANDEPIATATWLSHFLLCERVKEDGYQALFGGLGGDELNAGEYEYFFFYFADLKRRKEEARLAHETAKWAEYHDHPIYRKSYAVMEAGLKRLVDLEIPGRCLADPARLARYRDTVKRDYFDLESFVPIMDHPFSSYLKNRTYQDIYRETAPCCLRAADRQTRAFGLDVVWPFFDHRLVELMFRVPGELKIRDGVTKYLLREATTGVLPEETRTRIKKTGWNAPAHVWFSGKGKDLLMDLTGSQAFRQRGIYDVGRVQQIIAEHDEIVKSQQPVENHMMFLWQLLNLELWLASA